MTKNPFIEMLKNMGSEELQNDVNNPDGFQQLAVSAAAELLVKRGEVTIHNVVDENLFSVDLRLFIILFYNKECKTWFKTVEHEKRKLRRRV